MVKNVIEDPSFEVKKGDVITLLGPNGAGKTVLLRTLLGLLPHEGEIEWKSGIKLGYVPQRLPFIKDIPLSVNDFGKLLKEVPMSSFISQNLFLTVFKKRLKVTG
jgi:zinc transport system ATP-binding protein